MIDLRSVDRLFERSEKAIRAFQQSEAYREAFGLYKGRKYSECIDAISSHLRDDGDHLDRFMSYRLWIECLSVEGDSQALELIGAHLVRLVELDDPDYPSYVALGGLAFLEADSFGRARLMARCVLDRNDPYVYELVQRLRLRVGHGGREPYILRSKGSFTDYFHWELLVYCLDMWEKCEDKIKRKAYDFLSHKFNDHSLAQTVEYHKYLENNLFAAASLVADLLRKGFPKRDEFLIYQAFAFYEDADYPEARRNLSEYVRRNPKADSEVLGLLGMCHGKVGDSENAVKILENAIDIGSIEGISISEMAIELANIKDELSLSKIADEDHDSIEQGGVQNWMIKLSPSRYFQLMNSSPESVDRILLPLGVYPKEGDFVFFSAGEKVGDEYFWNVVAVYAVDSKPIRHSRHEFLSVLKLISRLPISVPIDVSVREDHQEELAQVDLIELGWQFDRHAVKKIAKKFAIGVPQNYCKLPKGYPYRYGVFQLDVGALELIEKAIENQSQNLVDRRNRFNIRRPTA